MKNLKYILLMLAVGLFSACSIDELDPAGNGSLDGNSTALISISSDDILPVDMTKTRAGEIDAILSKIQDLNVRVYLNSGTYHDVYLVGASIKYDGKNLSKTPEVSYINGHDLPSMTASTDVMMHIEGVKASEVKSISVIANAGKDLHATKNWDSVVESGDQNLNNGICMMYGIADAPVDNTHKVAGKDVNCKLYQVKLKRTRAMISVKIVNGGLKPGVTITPTKIRLCNTPTSCNLTQLLPAPGRNKISKIENSVLVSQEKDLTALSLGAISGDVAGSHVGEHDDVLADPATKSKFIPLYMYENMQGNNGNTSSAQKVTKFPTGITSVAEAKMREKNFPYSYIEIEADYKLKNKTEVKISGTIIYRFFLGNNDFSNFDIEGNKYYKLTLSLKGFGGAKEDGKVEGNKLVVNKNDLSWRVDMNTRDWGFEKDQYDFDGHFFQGTAVVVGSGWTFDSVLDGNGKKLDGGASWLLLKVDKDNNGTEEWVNPTQLMHGTTFSTKNGYIEFAVQPMTYSSSKTISASDLDPSGQFNSETYRQPKNFRELRIVASKPGSEPQTVIVRQYAPIPVYCQEIAGGWYGPEQRWVFMERFEEYPEGTVGYPWKWDNMVLTDLHDINGSFSSVSYFWGDNVPPFDLGVNTMALSHFTAPGSNGMPKEFNSHAQGGAADVCFYKGTKGLFQGAAANLYCLPSRQIMDAIIQKASAYEESWGPFEPIHIYDDYWTSSVEQNPGTETKFYDGMQSSLTNSNSYSVTSNRNLLKRIRAVYAPNPNYTMTDD